MGELNEMHFYESKDVVLGPQRVTLRVAKEQEDRYDKFQAGDTFVFKISNDFNLEEERRGVILGHWILPLSSIPIELVAGEAYDVQLDLIKKQEGTLQSRIRYLAEDDMSSHAPITSSSDMHVLAYSPTEDIDRELIQRPNEDPAQWVERCGDSVLGHIDLYQRLKSISKKY